MRGTVVWFKSDLGFGFIKPDGGGEDVFCHFSSIVKDGYKSLDGGDIVDFSVETGPKGKPQAAQVVILQKAVVA